MEKRKHVRDLAPFASSEDLSDERESPLDDDKQKQPKLSNIDEEIMKTPPKAKLNVTNVAPRIDISRASSSSHQEDSSPEREFFTTEGEKKVPKLEVAFGEDMASDLHSSTEELSFHETEDGGGEKSKRKKSSVQIFSDLQLENLRKDSACSDFGLLSISGRTSRVSSVGSVASAGSGISCYSHCSAASHLSAVSNLSRGSSPHRVSVETSFCGPKPVHTASLDVDDAVKCISADKLLVKTEVVSSLTSTTVAALTKKETRPSRKCLSSQKTVGKGSTNKEYCSHHKRKKPTLENPKTQTFVSLHSDEEDEPIASRSVKAKLGVESAKLTTASATASAAKPAIDSRTQIYIPLHGSIDIEDKTPVNPDSPKRLKPFTNTTLLNFIRKYDNNGEPSGYRSTRRAKSATEAEYKSNQEINKEFQKFIALRDDDDCSGIKHVRSASAIHTATWTPEKKPPAAEVAVAVQSAPDVDAKPTDHIQITVPIQIHHSASPPEVSAAETNTTAPPVTSSPFKQDLPKYLMKNDGTTIFIPLHGPDDETPPPTSSLKQRAISPSNYLAVSKLDLKSRSDDHNLASSASPNLDDRRDMPSLELAYRENGTRSTKSMTQLINIDHSRTPSPNASIHKNYGNNRATNSSSSHHQNYLYRRCSESAKEIHSIGKSKSRSGSFRSLFSTFFNRSGSTKHRKSSKADMPETSVTSTSSDYNFRIYQPKKSSEPDSIIIPLHSPDEIQPAKGLTGADKVAAENSSNTLNYNKTSSNSNDAVKSSLIPTSIKIEYSETKDDEPVNAQADLNIVSKDDGNHDCTSPTSLQPHQVQCEVTVHNDGLDLPADETPSRPQKLETIDSAESNTQDEAATQASFDKTDADCDKNSLILDNLAETPKDPKDEEATDASTDSDKRLDMARNLEERKKLVNQEESYEELPYVPTTLPLERSVALPIIPIKERAAAEVKTCPVDRPRCSGASLNATLLETYVTSLPATSVNESSSTEKLHITLPRTDAVPDSPRKKHSLTRSKPGSSGSGGQRHHSISTFTSLAESSRRSPPPLPPRKSSMSWISFDDSSHEIRQSSKRITTLPHSYAVEGCRPPTPAPPPPHSCSSSSSDFKSMPNQNFVFVNPDECSCDCHDNNQNRDV